MSRKLSIGRAPRRTPGISVDRCAVLRRVTRRMSAARSTSSVTEFHAPLWDHSVRWRDSVAIAYSLGNAPGERSHKADA